MIKKLVSVDELYAAFRCDIMGGLNYDCILREAKPVDAIPTKRIEELEQLDYELYCRIGKSHLNEQQWEWLKGVLKNETD